MANPKTLKPFKKGYDERRNYQGKPKGRRNFRTLFEEAIEKIALEKDLKGLDLEVEIIKRGIIEALKGKYQFWKEIMDRLFGKPKEEAELKKELEIEKIIEIEEKVARAIENTAKIKKMELKSELTEGKNDREKMANYW